MPWCLLNGCDDFLNFSMLFLKILQSIGLLLVLPKELFEHLLTINVNQSLLELACELVYYLEELLAYAHDHISYVLLPSAQVILGVIVVDYGLFGLAADFVEALHRGDVTLVDVLHVVLIDEAR